MHLLKHLFNIPTRWLITAGIVAAVLLCAALYGNYLTQQTMRKTMEANTPAVLISRMEGEIGVRAPTCEALQIKQNRRELMELAQRQYASIELKRILGTSELGLTLKRAEPETQRFRCNAERLAEDQELARSIYSLRLAQVEMEQIKKILRGFRTEPAEFKVLTRLFALIIPLSAALLFLVFVAVLLRNQRNSHHGIPPVAKSLIQILSSARDTENIIGDLQEEYLVIVENLGTFKAKIWLYKQTLLSACPLLHSRVMRVAQQLIKLPGRF